MQCTGGCMQSCHTPVCDSKAVTCQSLPITTDHVVGVRSHTAQTFVMHMLTQMSLSGYRQHGHGFDFVSPLFARHRLTTSSCIKQLPLMHKTHTDYATHFSPGCRPMGPSTVKDSWTGTPVANARYPFWVSRSLQHAYCSAEHERVDL